MKASELIKLINKNIEKYGDADCTVQLFNDDDNGGTYSIEPIVGVFRFHESKEVVQTFCLCDQETMEGFQENADPELDDDL